MEISTPWFLYGNLESWNDPAEEWRPKGRAEGRRQGGVGVGNQVLGLHQIRVCLDQSGHGVWELFFCFVFSLFKSACIRAIFHLQPIGSSFIYQDDNNNTYWLCVCAQLCPTLCDSVDCSPPVSSVCGIFQGRIPEWVAISYSRGSSQLRDRTRVSCIGWQILYHYATCEAIIPVENSPKSRSCVNPLYRFSYLILMIDFCLFKKIN